MMLTLEESSEILNGLGVAMFECQGNVEIIKKIFLKIVKEYPELQNRLDGYDELNNVE